jgi:hypothetical protein
MGDIRSINIFFHASNIIDAADSIKNIAHTLGFCTDDIKQIVENTADNRKGVINNG